MHAAVLWDQFSSGLRSFVFSKVKNDADTDDIMQNVFLKIHDNLHSLKDALKIKSWIYQITRNLIFDYLRIKKRVPEIMELKSELTNNPANRYMETAINDMIKMMDELPAEYCEALCMTEIEGLSQKVYAERKGLTYSAAKSRVQRARILLKDLLLQCCHYQFDKYGTVFEIQPKCCCCCDP